MNVGDWGGLAIGFSLWGNGLGLDRAGRYLYPFFPPAQQGAAEKPHEPVSLLDQLVRDGARKMLAAALQAEVAAYIEQFADVRGDDGHRLVVRNGYHDERAVVTGAGAVTVQAPRRRSRWCGGAPVVRRE